MRVREPVNNGRRNHRTFSRGQLATVRAVGTSASVFFCLSTSGDSARFGVWCAVSARFACPFWAVGARNRPRDLEHRGGHAEDFRPSAVLAGYVRCWLAPSEYLQVERACQRQRVVVFFTNVGGPDTRHHPAARRAEERRPLPQHLQRNFELGSHCESRPLQSRMLQWLLRRFISTPLLLAWTARTSVRGRLLQFPHIFNATANSVPVFDSRSAILFESMVTHSPQCNGMFR